MTLNELRGMEKEDILNKVGLQSYRSSAWVAGPAFAMFGLGVLIGAGIGLLYAPRSGVEFRHELSNKFRRTKDDLTSGADYSPTENVSAGVSSTTSPDMSTGGI